MIFQVDTREPPYIKNMFYEFFQVEDPSIQVESKELVVGDIIYDKLVIERKEVNDFVSSIMDGRYKGQKFKMGLALHRGFHVYVLIHGAYKDINKEHGLSKRAYARAIASLNECGIHTINLPQYDMALLCETVYGLMKKFNEDKVLSCPFIEPTGRTFTQKALQCIPGVGEELSKRITEVYPSFHSFYQGNKETMVEDLQLIDGIGLSLATQIMETLYD